MSDNSVSGEAVSILERCGAVWGYDHLVDFHKSLLTIDLTRTDVQRRVWQCFKLYGMHPDEDSELVVEATKLLRNGEFGSLDGPEEA